MTEENLLDGIGTSRISRCGVIKTGAVVGGAVWVAPVIDSFVSRAAAVSNPAECAGQTCETFTYCFSSTSGCVCATTSTGAGFCSYGPTCCSALTSCGPAGGPYTSCPPGYVCLVDTCCGNGVCYPNIPCTGTCPPNLPAGSCDCGSNGQPSIGSRT